MGTLENVETQEETEIGFSTWQAPRTESLTCMLGMVQM